MNDSDDKIRIVILEAGFVMVCRCPEPSQFPYWLPYSSRRTIRRWGTTKGLGELCNGPTSETVLDELVAEGTCPVRAIIDVLECSEEGLKAWSKVLGGVK